MPHSHIITYAPPIYRYNLLDPINPINSLRSTRTIRLKTYPYNKKRFGGRSFKCMSPINWNSIPINIRNIQNHSTFKTRLKICLLGYVGITECYIPLNNYYYCSFSFLVRSVYYYYYIYIYIYNYYYYIYMYIFINSNSVTDYFYSVYTLLRYVLYKCLNKLQLQLHTHTCTIMWLSC